MLSRRIRHILDLANVRAHDIFELFLLRLHLRADLVQRSGCTQRDVCELSSTHTRLSACYLNTLSENHVI